MCIASTTGDHRVELGAARWFPVTTASTTGDHREQHRSTPVFTELIREEAR